MAVRIGVDVGGTFTKAVACDAADGRVVARSVVPTTHASASGVADGVIDCVRRVAAQVHEMDAGPILLVTHSTTQAVNALLEGDTATVGIVGIGRRPDLRRARKRTSVDEVQLAPGRTLKTLSTFIDATAGIDRSVITDEIRRLMEQGADAICVSEAFGVDDARGEWIGLEVASELGAAACAGHELSGLYGLEMRTVTAALNASILPTSLRTARMVEEAVERDAPGVPLLVMRGDGGAADIAMMKQHPLVTAFSGPAASVAGALRHLSVQDGVVVEVGGTSTNVSTIKGGRPVLSYVRVLDHVTCVRSMDVRVAGIAGGSLIRIRHRRGRARLEDVGPRSAHIAGLPYACFSAPGDLEGAEPRLIAPRPGDPDDYVVLERRDGRRFALTVTCAANALGEVPDDAYARASSDSARAAFEALEALFGGSWQSIARAVVERAALKVAHVVSEAMRENELSRPQVIGLGGGSGALVPAVARALDLAWTIPPDAEVISSVGDALSLIRVEVERTLARADASEVARVHRDAEDAAIRAGAAPASIQVESEAVPERGALRAVAYGSVALDSAALADTIDEEGARAIAQRTLGTADLVAATDCYRIFSDGKDVAVVDRHGAMVLKVRASVVAGTGAEVAAGLQQRLHALVRHYGPIAVAPAVRILRGSRLIDLTVLYSPDAATQAALAECATAHEEHVVALIGRD